MTISSWGNGEGAKGSGNAPRVLCAPTSMAGWRGLILLSLYLFPMYLFVVEITENSWGGRYVGDMS